MTEPLHSDAAFSPEHATVAILDGIQEAWRETVDEYLSTYIDPAAVPDRCPKCERGGFTWSDAWGAGYCYDCGWPARLYHVVTDLREEPFLVCSATCNGYRVCEATRGEHIPRDVVWHSMDGTSSVETELRCPNPTPPPGLSLPFDSRYKPPEIASFTRLLWVHPDFVKERVRDDA